MKGEIERMERAQTSKADGFNSPISEGKGQSRSQSPIQILDNKNIQMLDDDIKSPPRTAQPNTFRITKKPS